MMYRCIMYIKNNCFPLLFDHTYFRYCTEDDVEHRNVWLSPINSLVYFVYSFIEIT